MCVCAYYQLHILIVVLDGVLVIVVFVFFFQAEDGIRDLVRSRGLGDVYKRQTHDRILDVARELFVERGVEATTMRAIAERLECTACLLYTSDAADERSSVDLGGRRIIKKQKTTEGARTTLTLIDTR